MHLPGVAWGDRVQAGRGALTACPPREAPPCPGRPRPRRPRPPEAPPRSPREPRRGDLQPTLWQGVGGAPPLPSSGIGGQCHSGKPRPSPAEGPSGVSAMVSAQSGVGSPGSSSSTAGAWSQNMCPPTCTSGSTSSLATSSGGPAAEEARNVFRYCTYEGAADLDPVASERSRKLWRALSAASGRLPGSC